MLRRVKRYLLTERRKGGHDSESEDEDVDPDVSMVEAGSRNIKQERQARGQGRREVDDIMDEGV